MMRQTLPFLFTEQELRALDRKGIHWEPLGNFLLFLKQYYRDRPGNRGDLALSHEYDIGFDFEGP